jgi:hypothetical protein
LYFFENIGKKLTSLVGGFTLTSGKTVKLLGATLEILPQGQVAVVDNSNSILFFFAINHAQTEIQIVKKIIVKLRRISCCTLDAREILKNLQQILNF